MLAELSPYLVSGESVLALATTSSLRATRVSTGPRPPSTPSKNSTPAARAAGLERSPDPVLRPLLSRWHAVLVGRATHAGRRSALHTRAHNLLKRLTTYRD